MSSGDELEGLHICQRRAQSYVEVQLQHDDCCYNR